MAGKYFSRMEIQIEWLHYTHLAVPGYASLSQYLFTLE